MRCKFKIDIKKDYKNYIKALSNDKWKDKVPTELKRENISTYLEEKYIIEKELIKRIVNNINKLWFRKEREIFRRIEEVTGKKTVGNFKIILTTIKFCPYMLKTNEIMIYYLYSPEKFCEVLTHELLHFNFHQFFFEKVEERIGTEKAHMLKESVTFLINEEFQDILKEDDKGYPKHQELRKRLSDIWKSEKNFQKLVEKGTEITNTSPSFSR
ncbi:hypothetical protein FJZ19_02145 [Candidatus Pacearchaeota archaeon]|nr:hypothetical protein [Candidatus Pacearchaeota archaeon]